MIPQAQLKLGQFPQTRLRRNRQHEWMRRLVAENKLSVDDLIQVVFVRDASSPPEIPSMPGVRRYTIQELVEYATQLAENKIPALAIFPFYDKPDRNENVVHMLTADNLACQALQALKKAVPHMGVITDVALDCYTTHGQDGIIENGQIHNDKTLDVIADYAVIQAQAGADIIAPSEMMDGRIGVIRQALDAAGYQDTGIMSYAAKYASGFYGPFRDAVGSKNCLAQADKKTYQMDPANIQEALREVAMDIEEGADSVMVKPGLPYLDVVSRVRQAFCVPTFVYQISGEYAMLKAAAANGWLDYDTCFLETLMAFKRAGADGILTYGGLEAAQLLQQD